MKFMIVIFLVSVALFHECSGSQLTTYGGQDSLSFLPGDNRAVNCTETSGNVCSEDFTDCDKIFLCINGMEPVTGECGAGLTCNQGKCSKVPSVLCEYGNLPFVCNTVGMYPEPSSCKKYNFCVPGETSPRIGECEPGFAYNHYTTLCDKKLPNNVCTDSSRVVPTCVTIGQNAAIKGNTALYYVCLPHPNESTKLYPHIYKCPGNTKYAGNYKCK